VEVSGGTQIKFLLVLLTVVVLLIIGIQNRYETDLQILFWTVRMNRALLFLLLFGAGIVAGMALSWYIRRERKPKPELTGS
jgi:uncharacterized integral membrane protein